MLCLPRHQHFARSVLTDQCNIHKQPSHTLSASWNYITIRALFNYSNIIRCIYVYISIWLKLVECNSIWWNVHFEGIDTLTCLVLSTPLLSFRNYRMAALKTRSVARLRTIVQQPYDVKRTLLLCNYLKYRIEYLTDMYTYIIFCIYGPCDGSLTLDIIDWLTKQFP